MAKIDINYTPTDDIGMKHFELYFARDKIHKNVSVVFLDNDKVYYFEDNMVMFSGYNFFIDSYELLSPVNEVEFS